MDSIPYKLRRDKVNEGREQVPYFLREGVLEAEDELQDTLEELLGEKVYKSDYREASMVVAQRNPELIAEVLREWGYDLAEI
jgi:flagellar biosynthesis/type III secretory pathway M-ring protein FliF/YscJ